MADYKINVMDTEKSKIPQRGCVKAGILPKFPSSVCFCGRSGSGKTNLLLNILTRKEMLGGYYHYILVFSPTANTTDDIYKALQIPEENFIPDFTSETFENIIKARKDLIEEKGVEWVGKHSRCLLIMDDIIANREFLQGATALKLFSLLRHYLCSIYILIQSYRKLPRSLRLNCNATYIFPSSQSEVEILKDEVCPAGLTKKQFEKVIDYATSEPYNFLSINNHAKPKERFRRNLNEIIDLDKFKN
jgi:GTP-binding protein EngB required for normal cell division